MLFHLSTLPLAIFLGAIVVSTTTSRYEDDDGFPALTDQANHHQQIIYDVDNGVNASFACDVDKLWNDGVQQHIMRAPWENNCEGGHAVSRYLSSLGPPGSEKIRNLILGPDFNHNTGLLTVLSYEYRTNAGPWTGTCKLKKTLWNDAENGAKLGERLKNLKVTLPAGFPEEGWTAYQFINIPKSQVEQQCKESLRTLNCAPGMSGSYVVPSVVNKNINLCVRVAMTGNKWATCYPAEVTAASKPTGSPCP